MVTRIFPFISWFANYNLSKFKIDFIAGLTVALVLIPQSMAYAQLAGLPAYYGLYASFLPPMIAALFGSSRQLATGPVAVVSLMTAASLEPMATAGSDSFIMYAVLLAMTVGIFQLALGVFRLGLVVNFLSHPVVNGFTNAAAIIIASSQLSKLFGVYVDKAGHHYETIIRIVESAFIYTHWPTLGIGILAILIMYILKRINPQIPYVLIAVAITTLISWSTGYEHNEKITISNIASGDIQQKIRDFNFSVNKISEIANQRATLTNRMKNLERKGHDAIELINIRHEINVAQFEMNKHKHNSHTIREELRKIHFRKIGTSQNKDLFYINTNVPNEVESDGRIWRIKLGNKILDENNILMMGGGDVVGVVPEGLPQLGIPNIKLNLFLQLFPFAVIISLLGFMEAIAIAKAMASKTGQRIDPNQELIGQGLSNILGSFGQSYPVSGSFSRSAINLQAGAETGMSSVVTSLVVIIALLFFTPLLYYLPKATLAAVIMMAVIGLVNISGFIHAYKAQWYDGIISIITFIATLLFAPHLEKGIYIGVFLSLGVFLYKSMRPKISSLSRSEDESLREISSHGLSACEYIDLIRFEGPLFFANASYLEDEVDKRIIIKKNLKHIIIAANGMNDIDTSGEEALSLIVDRLRSSGYGISFSGVNESVTAVLKRTHLFESIGQENIYPTMERALFAVHESAHQNSTEKHCPLLKIHKKNQLN